MGVPYYGGWCFEENMEMEDMEYADGTKRKLQVALSQNRIKEADPCE